MDKFVMGILVTMTILTSIVLITIYSSTEEKIVKVKDSPFSLKYTITGGNVLGATKNSESNSVIIFLDALDDGKIIVMIPNGLVDSKNGVPDNNLFLIVDGEESLYQESKTSAHRILTIQFVKGNQEIEIISTDKI
jgi:hypothetical protein